MCTQDSALNLNEFTTIVNNGAVMAKDISNFIQIKEIDMYKSITEIIKPKCLLGIQKAEKIMENLYG